MSVQDYNEKITNKAYKCFQDCKGSCAATYKTANEVCLYCLEFIKKIPKL